MRYGVIHAGQREMVFFSVSWFTDCKTGKGDKIVEGGSFPRDQGYGGDGAHLLPCCMTRQLAVWKTQTTEGSTSGTGLLVARMRPRNRVGYVLLLGLVVTAVCVPWIRKRLRFLSRRVARREPLLNSIQASTTLTCSPMRSDNTLSAN